MKKQEWIEKHTWWNEGGEDGELWVGYNFSLLNNDMKEEALARLKWVREMNAQALYDLESVEDWE